MNNNYLNTNGRKYLERLPQYITQYPKLMELMGYILEYIDNSIMEVNKINPKTSILSDLSYNYLQALISHYDTVLSKTDYSYLENYKDLLYATISGVWATMQSQGDRTSLQRILDILYPAAAVQINEFDMEYLVSVSTIDVQPSVETLLGYLLKTDITGVTEIFEFSNKNSFTWKDVYVNTTTEYIPQYVAEQYTLYPDYTNFTTTDEYVGYSIKDENNNMILVTSTNKDTLTITAGTTEAYEGFIQDEDSKYLWKSTHNNTIEYESEYQYIIDGQTTFKLNCGLYKQEYA